MDDGVASPGSQVAATEEAARLNAALARMPESYRRAVVLRNWEDRSFAEIGAEMGRTAERRASYGREPLHNSRSNCRATRSAAGAEAMDDRFAELLAQLDEGLRAGLDSHLFLDQVTYDCDPETRDQLVEAEVCLRLIDRVRRREIDPERKSRVSRNSILTIPAIDAIGRFELLEELGRGGHGIVFLAWDPAARRRSPSRPRIPMCCLLPSCASDSCGRVSPPLACRTRISCRCLK